MDKRGIYFSEIVWRVRSRGHYDIILLNGESKQRGRPQENVEIVKGESKQPESNDYLLKLVSPKT